VLFALLGCACGVFTGLVPGLHVNNVVVILVSASALLLERFELWSLLSFIVALSVTHSFVNYVPAILLGAPQEDNVLATLPGHRLLHEGRGYEAVRLTVLGGLGASLFCAAALPPLFLSLPRIYPALREHLPALLTLVLLYLIWLEGRRVHALLVVLYSGILGYLILNYPLLPPHYALFPALSGFFGIATLLSSLHAHSSPPEQSFRWERGLYPIGMLAGALGGIVAGLLPGIGSAQSAMLVQASLRRQSVREFLVAHGGVNTAAAIFALLALYLIGNPRSGASVAASLLLGEPEFADFLLMLAVALLASALAAVATLRIARTAIGKMGKISYSRLSLAVLLFLAVSILVLTGIPGAVVAATATAIGLFATYSGVRRSHCMGVLILPTILYFLGY
jgi:putative membrane protein